MFTPRHVKHSRLLLRHARKYLRYKNDRLSGSDREEIVAGIGNLRDALRRRDHEKTHKAADALDKTLHRLTPVTWESHWRENCEVILVAIVVAVGIRSYFLQPFKIPTGSMQPTLNGIIGHSSTAPAPNILRQISEFIVLGRNYINVVSRADDQVFEIEPKKFLFFFTFSRLICEHQNFLVYAPPETLTHDFSVFPGRTYHSGDIIARGVVDTGDQVFVDKFSYNFVKPHRGTFSFSEQIISLAFGRIRKPGRRFTSNGWPACQGIAYASTRHFFLSMEIKRKALDSSASWPRSLRIAVMP